MGDWELWRRLRQRTGPVTAAAVAVSLLGGGPGWRRGALGQEASPGPAVCCAPNHGTLLSLPHPELEIVLT